MDQEQILVFQTEDGKKIRRKDRLFVTVRREDQERWFTWLEEVGRSDLIKTGFNMNSLNGLVRKIIRGEEEDKALPDFLDLEKDIFFLHGIEIKLGNKSLRKAASEFSEDL